MRLVNSIESTGEPVNLLIVGTELIYPPTADLPGRSGHDDAAGAGVLAGLVLGMARPSAAARCGGPSTPPRRWRRPSGRRSWPPSRAVAAPGPARAAGRTDARPTRPRRRPRPRPRRRRPAPAHRRPGGLARPALPRRRRGACRAGHDDGRARPRGRARDGRRVGPARRRGPATSRARPPAGARRRPGARDGARRRPGRRRGAALGARWADVLPAGPGVEHPGETWGTTQAAAALRALRDANSWVLLDASPVATSPESVDLARLADGVVLVARRGSACPEDLDAAAAGLRTVGTPLIGSVFTFAVGVPAAPAEAQRALPPGRPESTTDAGIDDAGSDAGVAGGSRTTETAPVATDAPATEPAVTSRPPSTSRPPRRAGRNRAGHRVRRVRDRAGRWSGATAPVAAAASATAVASAARARRSRTVRRSAPERSAAQEKVSDAAPVPAEETASAVGEAGGPATTESRSGGPARGRPETMTSAARPTTRRPRPRRRSWYRDGDDEACDRTARPAPPAPRARRRRPARRRTLPGRPP